jgi:hypothetical protein
MGRTSGIEDKAFIDIEAAEVHRNGVSNFGMVPCSGAAGR